MYIVMFIVLGNLGYTNVVKNHTNLWGRHRRTQFV